MKSDANGPLIYRQSRWTRATHWVWAICLFFLMLTGLQIFNAHPSLHIGLEAGFEYDNAILEIGARQGDGDTITGFTRLFGYEFETTGILGVSADGADVQAFPAALTIPSNRSLATGRVIHFFFAWVLVGTLAIWASRICNQRPYAQSDPDGRDLAALPRDVADHARLRFHHTRDYNVLQKLAYASVCFWRCR